MELTIDEVHAKKLIKEVLLELMTERQDIFLKLSPKRLRKLV